MKTISDKAMIARAEALEKHFPETAEMLMVLLRERQFARSKRRQLKWQLNKLTSQQATANDQQVLLLSSVIKKEKVMV